jgi:hypothetical protein
MPPKKKPRSTPHRPRRGAKEYYDRVYATTDTGDTLERTAPRRPEFSYQEAPPVPPSREHTGLVAERSWTEIVGLVMLILALVSMAVGVWWYGHSVDKGVETVNTNVDRLTGKIDTISERTLKHSHRLDKIESGISNLDTELDKTKDLLNDMRVDRARK